MNYATLIPALIELLQHAPEFWQAVETFWNEIHAKAPATAVQHDEVRDAIAAARTKAP